MGFLQGSSKKHKEGLHYLGEKPHEFIVFNEPSTCDSNIIFYKNIDSYMEFHMKLQTDCTIFCMGIIHVDCTNNSRFLKRQPIGKNYFSILVKNS